MKNNEQWKPISGFPNYRVSNLGRVWSEATSRFRILRAAPVQDGYIAVNLYREGKQHLRYIHRLVCEAFSGPPPSRQHHAAHLDGDRANNKSSNLSWATPTENNHHKRLHGTTSSRLTPEQVRAITTSPLSQRKAGRLFGVNRRTIAQIRLGHTWSWLTGINKGGGSPNKQPASNQ